MILKIQGPNNRIIRLDNLSPECEAGIRNGLQLASTSNGKTLHADHLLAGQLARYNAFNLFLSRQGLRYDTLKQRGYNLPERSTFTSDSIPEDVEISDVCASDLGSAIKIAERVNARYVEPQHILVANLTAPEAQDVVTVLEEIGIDPKNLRDLIRTYIVSAGMQFLKSPHYL